MTTNEMAMDKMELRLNTEGMSESAIQKAQELEKTICADKDFIAAEDVEAACRAIAQHIDQTQEELMAKYEELKASLNEQFKSLMGERELTDEELDAVDGGSIGGWFKKNWKKLVVGSVLAVVGVACIVSGVGLIAGAVGTAAAAAANPAGALIIAAGSIAVGKIAGATAIGVGIAATAAGASQMIPE